MKHNYWGKQPTPNGSPGFVHSYEYGKIEYYNDSSLISLNAKNAARVIIFNCHNLKELIVREANVICIHMCPNLKKLDAPNLGMIQTDSLKLKINAPIGCRIVTAEDKRIENTNIHRRNHYEEILERFGII